MEESPIYPRTPRRSRLSSMYHSDYETAGEESDSSLYYSTIEDDKENELEIDEIPPTLRNDTSSRQSLLGKCLLKNLNHTPRNEFNKRVSFNLSPLVRSTSNHSSATAVNTGLGLMNILSEHRMEDDDSKKPKNERSSYSPQIPASSTTHQMFDDENLSPNEGSDTIDVVDRDQSLNSTIVANSDKLVGAIIEAIKEATIEDVSINRPASTSTLYLKTTGIPGHSTHAKQLEQALKNIPTTNGLSNLPIPKKITFADLSLSRPQTISHIPPSSRLSLLRSHSTATYGFTRPTGIPKASGARINSSIHSSVIPLSSLKCNYCDKSFAKKFILDVHQLEKCEKIPPARHRQLQRQQTL